MGKKLCNVALGRFQPFTKGHLQMLQDGYDKNGYPAVVFMIANTKFDSKHPFSDELIKKEMDEVMKNYDCIAATVPAKNANIVTIGEKLNEMGYEAHLWLCGDDREAQFKRQAENPKYREQGMFPDDFTTYTGTGRTEGVSGTAVREALKADDRKKFDSLVPKGASKLYDEFREELLKVEESLKSLAAYVEVFESANKSAKATLGQLYKWYVGASNNDKADEDGARIIFDNGMYEDFNDADDVAAFFNKHWNDTVEIKSTEDGIDWIISFTADGKEYSVNAVSFFGDANF